MGAGDYTSATGAVLAHHWNSGFFTLGCTVRIAFWWRTRGIDPAPKVAHAALQRTNRLAAGIAVVFTLWSFLLVPYGDAYTQSHVAFYMAITVISCIFCLMYVRSAAFMVTAIVNGAFVIFFWPHSNRHSSPLPSMFCWSVRA